MKRVYLIHCWDGTSLDGWYPWIQEKLNNKNIEVILFDMPNTNSPVIEKWVEALDAKVGRLDKDTYFIGHSIAARQSYVI